jgi:hypothetical protein
MAGDDPAMPERVDHERVPVAVALILRTTLQLRTQFNRPLHDGIHISHVNELVHGGSGKAAGWRCGRAGHRVGVLDHDHRVAHLGLRVHDGAAGPGIRDRSVAPNAWA